MQLSSSTHQLLANKTKALSVQPLDLRDWHDRQVSVSMLRADQVADTASGNKYFKLLPLFDELRAKSIHQLISFGGPYSNHIHALAHMAAQHRASLLALIRGENVQNATLDDVLATGAELRFIDRNTYRQRNDVDFLAGLQAEYPNSVIVPSGGSERAALAGMQVLLNTVNDSTGSKPFSHIVLAFGSGSTAWGLAQAAQAGQSVYAYAVVNDMPLIEHYRQQACNKALPLTIRPALFGGYAKLDSEHLDFIRHWLAQTGILLDPVYTGKLARQLVMDIATGVFPEGANILMIHTGGLQAWRGFESKVCRLKGVEVWEQIRQML